MKNEELDEIIAEYMDRTCYNCGDLDPGGCCYAVMWDDLSSRYTEDLDTLIPVVEKLELNMYVSYSPKTKKYRARVWEYFKIPRDELESSYIYEKTPALALAKACVRVIKSLK